MINVMATEISKEEARSKEMQDINQEKEIGAVAIRPECRSCHRTTAEDPPGVNLLH